MPLAEENETLPTTSRQLPPDLDGLDDEELARYLEDLVRMDWIDVQELHMTTHDGVIYLEGALPGESEHEILRNVLTNIAGFRRSSINWRYKDCLGAFRSLRGRRDSSRRFIPTESDHRTEDVTLTNEEGVNSDPPKNPPPPPGRKD